MGHARRRLSRALLVALLLSAHNGSRETATADAQSTDSRQIVVATPGTSKEAGEAFTAVFSYSAAGGERVILRGGGLVLVFLAVSRLLFLLRSCTAGAGVVYAKSDFNFQYFIFSCCLCALAIASSAVGGAAPPHHRLDASINWPV